MIRKTYLFVVLWGMVVSLLPAQSAYRHLFLEHFTNTRCVLCPDRNAQLYTLLDQYPGQVHHLSIHPSVPYNNCVLYQHNPVDNNARKNLYGVNATPRAFLWGASSSAGTTLLPEATLLSSRGKTADVGITVNENGNGPLPQVFISVRTFENPDSGEYRLFAAVVERTVDYTAPNGETEHRNVFRLMLPNSEGEPFTPAEKGETVSFSYTYTPDAEWDMTQIYVMAFVQNMTTREVLNSGTAVDLKLSLSAFPNGTATTVVSGGIPPYTYRWNDPDSQTTATAIGLDYGLYKVIVTDSVGVTVSDTVRVEWATSLEDEISIGLKVYPSPAKDIIFVELALPIKQIEVVDMHGRQIRKWSGGLEKQEPISLNIKNFTPGVYVLIIQGDGLILRRRFLIAGDF
ncbi:MAG: Omp28-related outer membrane protein [Bacteroidia bacterium]|nr:Omp28-related outer membrane protein [Bacteroidia bacterium]